MLGCFVHVLIKLLFVPLSSSVLQSNGYDFFVFLIFQAPQVKDSYYPTDKNYKNLLNILIFVGGDL
jgi:hypothetical protein